ncbi:ets DNA-binding protein pokkuri isoform X2 [Eurytemora carolleeae]|uniref:ets DNA-binding protein pokkuri isoform X2 n=1 Tax=Eurytemora carolleeae TaxID=1294199 RepID=UPI000C764AE5|nr:ets DNA-binding protein pokkuri isoform X2 [Eurytemora carolleeae]|eukprot:XP_023342547.1 ets DNA-binding protein pokkuri-like isoform X2 [Eurytemora affinis]
MKVPPITLPTGMDRLPLPLPFSPDLLWRYPNPFVPPPSPLETHVKSGLPGGLPSDPKSWNREDVSLFMSYCEREFDLEKIEMDKFQMNGKALCFLSKNDLAERCSGAGDVIHNILQMLLREASAFPSSPLTPRPPGLMTPTSPSPFHSHWPLLNSSASETFPNLSHLISQTNSVTLSPAPSLDSTSGHSPKQENMMCSLPPLYLPSHLAPGTGSSNSDSEDSMVDSQRSPTTPATPTSTNAPRSPGNAPSSSKSDDDAPSTNGRLLWDFLQQLLNDQGQRYTSYIQWKNKDTGVFKIVDPAGLARLWGIQKNHLSMNYDKMSRALRYYYRVNILRKVQGERHCYQFLRNPSELKSIKNISLLRQQMEAQAAAQQLTTGAQQLQAAAQQAVLGHMSPIKSEDAPVSPHSDEPTDLSTTTGRDREERERERIEREKYYSQLMERYNIERSSPSRFFQGSV